MTKRMSRWISIVLVVFLLVGCTPAKPSQQVETSDTTLNGVDIGKYSIVYSFEAPDYCKRAADYIQKQITERTGVTLPVREASSGTFFHAILVGDTSYELSQEITPKTNKMEFYLLADENHIAINADYFIIAAAAYYFVETYIPGATFQSVIPQEVTTATPITEKANNYIFLIGDGMGFTHTKMFDYMDAPTNVNFYDGEDVFYGYYLPYQGKIQTDSLSGVTDSAAAGTALSCGYKTTNGRIGRDQDGNDLQSLTELAASKGMATAVMSTDTLTGATPAAFFAHAMDRADAEDITACSTEKIDGGTIITCGLDGDPSYQTKITNTLSELEKSENGFFVMYEEGHIDKHSHNHDRTNTFYSVVRFNQAIGVFMEYAFYHPDTFVIITADHETGGLAYDYAEGLTYTAAGHTGAEVPIFGYGQGAEAFKNCWMQNNEIPKIIAALWDISNFGG